MRFILYHILNVLLHIFRVMIFECNNIKNPLTLKSYICSIWKNAWPAGSPLSHPLKIKLLVSMWLSSLAPLVLLLTKLTILWLSNLWILVLHDYVYSRNASCELNQISIFLFSFNKNNVRKYPNSNRKIVNTGRQNKYLTNIQCMDKIIGTIMTLRFIIFM